MIQGIRKKNLHWFCNITSQTMCHFPKEMIINLFDKNWSGYKVCLPSAKHKQSFGYFINESNSTFVTLQAQHWSAHSNQNAHTCHTHTVTANLDRPSALRCREWGSVYHISKGVGEKKTITIQYQKRTMQAVCTVLSTNLSKAQHLHALQNSTKLPAGQDEIFGQCKTHELFDAPRGRICQCKEAEM